VRHGTHAHAGIALTFTGVYLIASQPLKAAQSAKEPLLGPSADADAAAAAHCTPGTSRASSRASSRAGSLHDESHAEASQSYFSAAGFAAGLSTPSLSRVGSGDRDVSNSLKGFSPFQPPRLSR
jgi:hypothetical protein